MLRVETTANQVTDEYHYYLEKARWGDADAYVKLADCYRNGVGVKMDFMGSLGVNCSKARNKICGQHRCRIPITARYQRESYASKTNFWNNLAIEEVDDALGVTGISLRVGDHHDGSALLVQLGQQLHYF